MPGISATGTLARYFSRRFLLAMMAMFLVCCVLIFFVDFIEMLRRAGNYSSDVPGLLLAYMTLLRLPSFSELVLPFAVLIGTIGVFLMLSRSSELVVLRAAGISVWQFTLPAMLVAFLLGIAFVLLYNPIAAVARGEAERLYAAAFGRGETLLKTKNAGAWLREDGTDGPSVIHADDVLNQGLELKDVTIFQYDREHALTERIEAKRALLKDTTLLIGSDKDCGLSLTDQTVSRRHLEVTRKEGAVTLRDLGSKNGSFVEGTRFESIEVRVGSEFRVGETVIKLIPHEEILDPLPLDESRFGALTGNAPAMRKLFTLIEKVAKTQAAVLLEGETGVGKEVVAEEIHRRSARRDKPFVMRSRLCF